MLPDAMAPDKDHGLEQEVGSASFALNVIHSVIDLHVCIEPENHSVI